MSVANSISRWIRHEIAAIVPFTRDGRRHWRKTVFYALALLGLFWLAEILLLPFLVNRQLKKVLAKLGFPNATFVVRSVTTDRADIIDVSASGVDAPTIDSAVIRFTWWKIVRGQLGEIDITGAKVIIDPSQGIGNLGHRHKKTAAERLIPDPIDDFPFDRIVVHSSMLVIRTADREIWIPTSGTLSHMGFDSASFTSQSQINGAEFDVAGHFDTDHRITDMHLNADALGLDGLIDLVRSHFSTPIRGGGVAAVLADFHDDPAAHNLKLKLDPHDAWMDTTIENQNISFDRADFHLESDFDDAWSINRFLATGVIPHATIGDKRISDIRVAALPVDSRTYSLEAKASASLSDVLPPAVALHQIDLTKLADTHVRAQAMLLLAAPASSDPAWRLDAVKLGVNLPPSEASLPGRGITLHGLEANIPLEGAISPDAIQLKFANDADIQISSADITGSKITPSDPAQPLLVANFANSSAVTIHLNQADKPWIGNVHLTTHGQPIDIASQSGEIKSLETSLSLDITADPTRATMTILPGSLLKWAAVSSPGATMGSGQIVFSGSVAKPLNQPPIVDTTMRLDKTTLHLESANCDFQDMQANIPLRWNVATPLAADASHFSIASVNLPTTKLPGIDGSISFNDGQLGFNVTWPILPSALVNGQAKFSLTDTGPTGEVDLQIPEFVLSDPKALTNIWPAASGFVITGNFSANADLKIEAGKLLPHAVISAHTVHVESAAYSAVLDDVDTRVELSSIDPLATPGDQAIYVRNARIGNLSLDNGEVHYRIENPHSILIEQTQWDFAAGQIKAKSFRVDPAKPVLDVDLQAQNLQMKSLLETFLPGDATGDGSIYGLIPVRLRWPRIFFGKGFLYAAPGQGEIQLGAASVKVGEMLDGSDPRFKTDRTFKQLRERAVSAVRDFQYDVLKADWENSEDGMVGVIHLSGKGKGDDGQGLNLNLNFSGLDKAFTHYLIIKRDSSQTP